MANEGQWPREVHARVQTNGMTAWITADGVTYDYFRRVARESPVDAARSGSEHHNNTDLNSAKSELELQNPQDRFGREGHVLRTRFAGAATEVVGQSRRAEYSNFFYGISAEKQIVNVPIYDRFIQKSVAPGVDIEYMLQDGRVRYDVHLAPMADVRAVQFRVDGALGIRVSEDGKLLVQTSLGEIAHQGLYAFQTVDGREQEVECRFAVQAGNIVGFEVGTYNRTLPLVIDPIVYSTIIGGEAQDDPNDIVVDDTGAAFLTGSTNSSDFPTTAGAYDETISGTTESDVFVLKLDPSGTSIVWSTYVGEQFAESGTGIDLDPDGNVVVAGWTRSDAFPVMVTAYDASHNGDRDVFVLKLSPAGNTLLASTFMGSAGLEECRALDVDRLGNNYIGGFTNSRLFPSDGIYRGAREAFVAKLAPDLTARTWSTFMGGSADDAIFSIAVDADQSVFVGGTTTSQDFFLVNPWDDSPNGLRDAFLGRIAPDGQSEIFSTYIGGRLDESMGGIVLDNIGDLYFCGTTFSNDFPMTPATFDPNYKGGGDGYYGKMLRDGSDMVYTSFLGAESGEDAHDIAVTENREPVIFGLSRSVAFPVTAGACAPDLSGASDLFVAQMNAAGNRLVCSSFIGGKGENEFSRAIDIGPDGNFFLAGRTLDDEFPTTDFTEGKGGTDLFIVKYNCNPTDLDVDAGPDQIICFGDPVTIGREAIGGTPGYSYQWEPEAGLSDPNAARPRANPAQDTEYIVFVTDATGCRVLDRVVVLVRERLFAEAGEEIEACFGDDVTIGGAPTGSGGVGTLTYSWSPTLNLDDPTLANPTVTVSSVRPTTYRVTITDGQGCTTTDSIRVVFNVPPDVNPGEDKLVCASAVAVLGGSPTADGPTGPFTYLWEPPLGLDDPTSPNPLAELSTNANFTVKYRLTVTDSKNCSTTDSVTIRYNSLRIEPPEERIVCPNESVSLGVTVLGFAGDENDLLYNWSPQTGLTGSNTANPTFEETLPRRYSYVVTVTDPVDGCQVSETVVVRIPGQPSLTTSPLIVNFPTLGGCDNSAVERLTVRNTNGRAFEIKRIEFEGPFALAQPFNGILLGDNQTLDLDIVYNPLAPGTDEGAIILILTDCEYKVEVQLRGRKTAADIAISTTVLDFGTSVICRDADVFRSFWIYNLGDGDVEIQESDAQNPFETSTFLPQRLAAGDSLEIAVRFSAWQAATPDVNAVISLPFTSEACSDTLRVSVFGRALNATLTPPISQIDFPALTGCEQERDTTLTLRNDSEIDIELRRLDDASILTTVPPLPLTIGPGDEQEIRIRFRPVGEGDFSGSLDFEYGHCDSTFAIAFSGAKRGVTFGTDAEVDLGTLVSCSAGTLESVIRLEYTGDADVDGEIRNVRVTGPFEQDLVIGTLLPRDGTSVTGAVRLDRAALGAQRGIITGSVFVLVEPCNIELEIALVAEVLDAELTLSAASAAEQATLLAAGEERVIEFVNSGTAPITLGTAVLDLPGVFTIIDLDPAAGSSLAAGASVRVRVRYEGDAAERQTTMTLASDAPCAGLTASVILRGEANDIIDPPTGSVTISVNEMRRAVGEVFDVVITLEESENLVESGAESYTFDLRFHRSMMVPLDAAFAGLFDGEDRVISFSGATPAAPGVLHRFAVRSLWGYDSCDIVEIDTVLWTGGDVISTEESGSICLTDLCDVGDHTRLFLSGAPTALRINTQVPVRSGVLDFSLEGLERGEHKVYLLDAAGRTRYPILDQEFNSSNLDIQAPLGSVPNGAYILVVETPRLRLTEMLTILR